VIPLGEFERVLETTVTVYSVTGDGVETAPNARRNKVNSAAMVLLWAYWGKVGLLRTGSWSVCRN
jgi:hypothetical protein